MREPNRKLRTFKLQPPLPLESLRSGCPPCTFPGGTQYFQRRVPKPASGRIMLRSHVVEYFLGTEILFIGQSFEPTMKNYC